MRGERGDQERNTVDEEGKRKEMDKGKEVNRRQEKGEKE